MIRTLENSDLGAKGDVLDPKAWDNEIGRDATTDITTSPTILKTHDRSVDDKFKEWLDGIDADELSSARTVED